MEIKIQIEELKVVQKIANTQIQTEEVFLLTLKTVNLFRKNWYLIV